MNYTLKEKSNLLIDEAIELGRNKPVKSTQIERLQLIFDGNCDKFKSMPQPVRLAYGLNYILENVSCPVEEYDILLSRVVDRTLTDEEETWLAEASKRKENGDEFFLVDWGHVTFEWDNIIKRGISGLINHAEDRLQRALAEGTAEADNIIWLEAFIHVYKAYRRYILRYADAADAKGLHDAATVCRNIAYNPPKTFVEGIQLVLFITHIYSVYSCNANATLSMGRVDDYLYPFYERDIANGVLTREEAGYIIDDFNVKSTIILGRGEHQMSGGSTFDTGWFRNPMYDSPTYAIIGGLSNHRDGCGNDLTKLFLERIHPRFENPVYVLRRTDDIADDMWTVACDKLRANSTLVVYNDNTVIPALERAGFKHEDAVDYTFHGCNWIDFNGKGKGTRGINGIMPKIIMGVLWDKDGNPIKNYNSIDEVYDSIGASWRNIVNSEFGGYRAQFRKNPPKAISFMYIANCFLQNTIEQMNDNAYTGEYNSVYCQIRNVGTAADIMTGLDEIVFKKKLLTMEEFGQILKNNFEGREDVLKICKNLPKYGQDNDVADAHAIRLMNLFTDITYEESINKATGEVDVCVTNVTITDMWHRGEGNGLGATPDGRLKGKPLSENLSPTTGYTESVTALLNSVAKLPMDRFASGALNVRMPKNLVAGDDGLERCKILFSTYFENGGMQLQLSVADTEELRDAQLHPEKYPDLMVRITGYSAVFIDMCRSAQDEIIRRDEVC